MIEWIITSCVLIVIVLLLRLCLKKSISLRLRYALWLLVLVRLLIPVNFFSSPMSVMNVMPEAASVAEVQQPQITYTPELAPSEQVVDIPASQVPILSVNPMPITPESPEVQEPVQIPEQQQQAEAHLPEKTFSYVLLLQILWVAGMVVTAFVFLFSNIRFALRLKRTRQADHTDCPLPVYCTAVIDTPCLFGLLRPAIYLTEEAGEDEGRQHILTHELTHYKHLDHIWGFLRCICLILHWYNPLVWMAAILSRRDSELACDEAVIKQLGEENRAAYGKTLIRMTCTGQNIGSIFTTATTMTGSKKTITQRIKLIVKHPKTAAYAVVCLVLVAAITVGCTFTGAKTPKYTDNLTVTEPQETESTEPTDTQVPEGQFNHTYPFGRLIYVNGQLYAIHINLFRIFSDEDFYKIGSITSFDPNCIPSTEFSSNYFPVGTEIYRSALNSDNLVYSDDFVYIKNKCEFSESGYAWITFMRTNMESLHSGPVLTMNELKDIVDRQSPTDLGLYWGNSFTSGVQSFGCQLQDADCFVYMYHDQFKLVRFSDLHELDLYTEKDLDEFLKNEQLPEGPITMSGVILQKGFDLYADYMNYTVSFSNAEQSYYFSTHNHLFVAELNVLINGINLSPFESEYDEDLKFINIGLDDANYESCSININEADQLKISVADTECFYKADGLYELAVQYLSNHTQKADKYYKVDNISNPHTYSVYGFDTSVEENRTPYWASLTDDNFVYVWAQYGTGTMARRAKFYDPKYDRISPVYYGPTDYYQNMVVSYGYNDEGNIDFCTVQVCDIFSGEVLFTVDEYKTPINRSMWNAVNLVYFNRDGSAILVNYYDEDYNLQWDTVVLPTEIRVNRTVGPASRKIPDYDSGVMTEKPWEKQESLYSGVPDIQAAKEIAQAIMDEKFQGYSVISSVGWYDLEGPSMLYKFENEDHTKWVTVCVDMQTGWIEGIWPIDDAKNIKTPETATQNLLTSPVIADAETAGRIAEAIRAGWVRQSGKYIPYLCVQEVFYEEVTGYWVVSLWPAVNYPVDQTYYIVLDSKDGHIVNMWAESG